MDNLFFCFKCDRSYILNDDPGTFFRHIGWMDEEFASKMNKFVFKVPLPLVLFGDLATVRFFGSLECKICYFLFYCNLDLHYKFQREFPVLEG